MTASSQENGKSGTRCGRGFCVAQSAPTSGRSWNTNMGTRVSTLGTASFAVRITSGADQSVTFAPATALMGRSERSQFFFIWFSLFGFRFVVAVRCLPAKFINRTPFQ
jgi:hypothetical protein